MDSAGPTQGKKNILKYRELCGPIISFIMTATGFEAYESKPGDVVIATFPKSGTVLLQNMLLHLVLETDGGPDWDPDGTKYTGLNDMVPVIEFSPSLAATSSGTTPRIFATHSPASKFDLDNKECRYIYGYRDGQKIPGSYLDFIIPWTNPGISIPEENYESIYHDYVRSTFLAGNLVLPEDILRQMASEAEKSEKALNDDTTPISWFEHIKGWVWKKRSNVLVLQYEKMAKDIIGAARTMAEFLGLQVSEEGFKRVAAACDRENMSKDPRLREIYMSKKLGLNPNGASRARMEGKGGFRDCKFDQEEEQIFVENLRTIFGVGDYPSLVEHIEMIQNSDDSEF